MRRIIDTLGGLWELLLLAVKMRGRLRGRPRGYWQWRRETAFGSDPARMPSRRRRLRAILDFGRWLRHMKRLR